MERANPMVQQAAALGDFQRYLLTGCETGVYRPELRSHEAAAHERSRPALCRLISANGPESIEEILNFEFARPEAALHLLALAASPRFAPRETNERALAALPLVARTASDLAAFTDIASQVRGWGRGLRSAVADWYVSQPPAGLAAQILRRPDQNLKQHRAILRRAHPKAGTLSQNALFQWIADGRLGHLATPEVRSGDLYAVEGFERLRDAAGVREAARTIEEYRLGPAQVDAKWKSEPLVWEALFDRLSYRQTLRYLPAMSACGFLRPRSDFAALAVARIADKRRLRAGKIHPLRIVDAMKRYRRPDARPVEAIFDALDEAFHLAVQCMPQVDRGVLTAIDGTASMQGALVHGFPSMTAALAASAFALSLPGARAVAFHREVRELDVAPKRTRLVDLLNQVRAAASRSDAASPIRWARERRQTVNTFIILTDRASSAPDCLSALAEYRESTGIAARLVLVNLASTDVNGWERHEDGIAFAGFDHGAPAAISAFLGAAPESDRDDSL